VIFRLLVFHFLGSSICNCRTWTADINTPSKVYSAGIVSMLQAKDAALTILMDKVESQWRAGVWVGESSVVVGLFALIRYVFHR
jgi:hypothetical protein